MIKYNLICKCGETFESWFSSSDEYDVLRRKKLINCIYCDSTLVRKSVMAPNLFNKTNKISKNTNLEKKIKKQLLDLRKYIEKNGIMFVATINKNLKSYLYAILGAEYILRWLPIGTHDWDKFLTPQELEIIAIRNNFTMNEMIGMKFNLFSKKWCKSTDASVNYISAFSKN